MTSFSPQALFDNTPVSLVEVERYCRRCKECWPVTPEFWVKDAKSVDGFKTMCKACVKEQQKKIVCTLAPEVSSKACITCLSFKPATKACFFTQAGTPDGLSGQCRTCNNKARRERQAALKAGISRLATFTPTADTVYKVCNACGVEKPQDPTFWHRSPVTNSGLLGQCKACTNAARKKRRESPGVKIVLQNQYMVAAKGEPVRAELAIGRRECIRCEVTKSLTTEFWHESSTEADGFDVCCRVCVRSRKKDFHRKLAESNIRPHEFSPRNQLANTGALNV